MPVSKIPDEHHLVRFVKPAHIFRDGQGHILGVSYAAFDLRPNEAYLSTNYLEKAGKDRHDSLRNIRTSLEAKLKIKNGLLTVGVASNIKGAFAPHKIRLTHEPTKKDPSYSAVRRYPLERRIALERLAATSWANWIRIEDAD